MIAIRPATLEDAQYVGANLRAEDEREVQTSAGLPGSQVVPLSYHCSAPERYTVWHNAKPVALFGVVPCFDEKLGSVWMLCTDGVRHCGVSLVDHAKPWLDRISRRFPKGLTARADARNTLHLRWCKLAGFKEHSREMVNGHLFINIYREAPHV